MAYRYEMVASGSPEEITRIIRAEEQHIPEGGLAELRLTFRFRFPGFEAAADQAYSELARKGVRPWPDGRRLVEADPNLPVWYVRWRKGAPWAPVVVAAIIAVAVLLIVWMLYRVVQPAAEVITQKYPWVIPILVVGGIAALLAWSPPSRAAPKTEKPGGP